MNYCLTHDNYRLYAAKNYDNSQYVTTEEFESDLRIVIYIKKLCTKYKEGRDVDTRLLLNHVIVMNNLFGPVASTKMLWLKAEKHFDILLPILKYLNICPHYIMSVNKKRIITFDHIIPNVGIEDDLRKV